MDASVSDEHVREFEQRLMECHRVVYRVAYGVLRDRADAEEIAQEAFLRAYRKLSRLPEPEKFRAWVVRVCFRLALNRRRDLARARSRDTSWLDVSAPSPADVEALVAQREFQQRLEREIDRLPEKLHAVVVLSAVQELSTRDIARTLGIPEGTVRSRLHAARQELFKVFCDGTLR